MTDLVQKSSEIYKRTITKKFVYTKVQNMTPFFFNKTPGGIHQVASESLGLQQALIIHSQEKQQGKIH